MIITTSL